MSNERGVFAVSRDIFDHPLFKKEPFTKCQAWIWLLAQASWKRRRVRTVNGRSVEMLDLRRGQLTCSRNSMKSAWRWSSEKRVRTFLKRLETDAMITVQTDALQSVITICKYDIYQFSNGSEDAQTDPQTDAPRASKGPESKKERNRKKRNTPSRAEGSPQFSQWYSTYPKKVDGKEAERCFNRLMANGEISFEDLMAATARYAAAMAGVDQKYIKAPAVWINKGSYLDEAPPAPNPGSATIEDPTRDPRTFSDAYWRSCLKQWNEKQKWSASYWGPTPGQPGCCVPARLLLNNASTCTTEKAAS
jgi:hypothetical protein